MSVRANELQARIDAGYARISELEDALMLARDALIDDLIRKWLMDELGALADEMLKVQESEVHGV